jgi:hypothetical protein
LELLGARIRLLLVVVGERRAAPEERHDAEPGPDAEREASEA